MTYIQKAAAVEAFLTGRRIPEEDVLTLDISKIPVRVHVYAPLLSGVTWAERDRTPGNIHYRAEVVQDGVAIELTTVLPEEVAA